MLGTAVAPASWLQRWERCVVAGCLCAAEAGYLAGSGLVEPGCLATSELSWAGEPGQLGAWYLGGYVTAALGNCNAMWLTGPEALAHWPGWKKLLVVWFGLVSLFQAGFATNFLPLWRNCSNPML